MKRNPRKEMQERACKRGLIKNIFLCDVFSLREHIRMQLFNIIFEQTANVSDLTRIVREGFHDESLVVAQSNYLRHEGSESTKRNYS